MCTYLKVPCNVVLQGSQWIVSISKLQASCGGDDGRSTGTSSEKPFHPFGSQLWFAEYRAQRKHYGMLLPFLNSHWQKRPTLTLLPQVQCLMLNALEQ